MTRPKINIRIRQKVDSAERLKIEIKEKTVYVCGNCKNRYYALTQFCPECLAELAPIANQPRSLKILSISSDRETAAGALLAHLSGQQDFEFAKALRTLPWIMIENTDTGVLQHWKEILDAENIEADIVVSTPAKPRKRKGSAPLFSANAPLPILLRLSVITAVRSVAKKITDPRLRMKWNDAVLTGWNLLEFFYKKEPASRILFPDFLFQIEHLIKQSARDCSTKFKDKEQAFATRISGLKQALQQMEAEIQAVNQQVEDQL
jgi:hypothetical protein